MDRIIVAGGGVAGLRAAETLRERGYAGELILLGEETHRTYQRPPLSKALLAGTMEPEACGLRDSGAQIDWRLGCTATGLDLDARAISVDDGTKLSYDGLVIATGRRPRPWPGGLPELAGFHALRTLDDALALRAALAARPKVVIVGAGFIGCEVAATLRGQDLEVTVLEMGPLPLPALGPEIGRRAQALHTAHGVDLRLGVTVEGFAGDGRVRAVRLAGGEAIPADLVLLALGSVPNTEWLQSSGIGLHRGAVLVDSGCAVPGTAGVVAAGDVAAWPHPHSDAPVSVEHWTNAGEMAIAAAANLLRAPADREPFSPVPTFWSDQYEVKIKSAGLFGLADRQVVVEEETADTGAGWRLVLEGHRGEQLVGAVTFNRNRSFIDYRRRIEQDLAPRRDPASAGARAPAPR
ncbi:MAG TPA: FAD/NAD(P)-binding oxidoreductase [Solirubrobacteraceae bacterium]|nr:FAD/NAD(P)-binding oxidoreductase [Solirubrobacteraceae bacterium]